MTNEILKKILVVNAKTSIRLEELISRSKIFIENKLNEINENNIRINS